MKTAFLFPGQGSQAVGMGADLSAHFPAALKTFEQASAQLGYKLESLCFYGPAERLSQTDITQPALFTTSVAALSAISELGIEAEAVAGHSVGEYAALYAAGALDFQAGLRLVSQRGSAMHRAAVANPGAMAAVIGLEAAIVTEVCQEAALSTGSVVVPANFNGAGQVVISGTSDAVTAAGDLAKAKGARKVIFLPVSGGFHSPLMKPAAEEMSVYFEDSGITDAKLPVVANVTAEYETDADVIRQNLAAQVAGAIRWEESMNRFLSDGFDFFIEIGSGSVLSSLIKRMSKDVRVYSVFDAAGVEAVKAALGVS